MRSQQSGFTLVEIAIVLVIIGLLLGGILKGQELINSAKVKNLANDFRVIPTYIYAYQDKFKSLPGDDPQVVAHLGNTATQAGASAGNSVINGAWDSSNAADESFLFWQHVRMANLAAGSTNPAVPAEYQPRNAVGFSFGVLLFGQGQVWLDDVAVERVTRDVPLTGRLGHMEAVGTSREELRAEGLRRRQQDDSYRLAPLQPVNLSFTESAQGARWR